MTEQLVLPIARVAPPSFDDFVVGRNAEVVAAVRTFALGAGAETGFLLWGAPGAGKTHLARAAAALARDDGQDVAEYAASGELAAVDVDVVANRQLVIVDAVDTAPAAAQGALFSLFNALREAGGRLLACSRTPLARLPLREDLRTRLGWGIVRELLPLTDDEKPEALVTHARQRGFTLADEVVRYLLAHGRRDMPALVATLALLDRESLARKRPITIPMLKKWLSQGPESRAGH